jgi:DNA-directed RNA polymerase specialized sigma subunit
MWKSYNYIVRRYPKISLDEERRLILEAQNGSKQSENELILRHISFLVFRINRKLFPEKIRRYGEDILSEVILLTYQKINNYDLDYCDKQGNPRPVKFVSYIWKRIDGFIIDSLKKEFRLYKIHKEYYENKELYEEDDGFNAYKRTKIDHRKNKRWRPI